MPWIRKNEKLNEGHVKLTKLSYDELLMKVRSILSETLSNFVLSQEIGWISMKKEENLEIVYMFLRNTSTSSWWILQEKLNKVKENIWEKAIRGIFKVCLLDFYKENKSSYGSKRVIWVPQAIFVETWRKEPTGFEKELAKMKNTGNHGEDLDNGLNDEELSGIFSSLNENPNKVFEDLYERWENWRYQIYKNIENFIDADKSLNAENKRKLSEIIEKFMYIYPENCLFMEDYLTLGLPF